VHRLTELLFDATNHIFTYALHFFSKRTSAAILTTADVYMAVGLQNPVTLKLDNRFIIGPIPNLAYIISAVALLFKAMFQLQFIERFLFPCQKVCHGLILFSAIYVKLVLTNWTPKLKQNLYRSD
jgi:hypothetical protein